MSEHNTAVQELHRLRKKLSDLKFFVRIQLIQSRIGKVRCCI